MSLNIKNEDEVRLRPLSKSSVHHQGSVPNTSRGFLIERVIALHKFGGRNLNGRTDCSILDPSNLYYFAWDLHLQLVEF